MLTVCERRRLSLGGLTCARSASISASILLPFAFLYALQVLPIAFASG